MKITIRLTVAEGPVSSEVASSALAAGAIAAEDACVLGVDAEAEPWHAQRRLVLLLPPAARVFAEPPRRRRRVIRRAVEIEVGELG